MKKAACLLSFLCISFLSFSQSIIGTWTGQLDLGQNKIRIVFHISEDESGYNAQMDSPDQGAKGIPVSSVTYEKSHVFISISDLNVEFNGKVADELIDGIFIQNGMSTPLVLSKGEIKALRPQEPQPPYPYQVTEVFFPNKQAGITLAGTLTLPSEEGLFPAVILISGSGPQNRDEEIFEHKPFLLLADYLTRRGIAVLRFDDRGVNLSTGDFSSATSEDFMTDALSAMDYLLTLKNINKKKIGFIGHSEGAGIAFMAAAQNKEVNFVVSMAGMAVRGDSLLLQQNRDLLLAENFAKPIVEHYLHVLRPIFQMMGIYSKEYIEIHYEELSNTIMNTDDFKKLPESLQQNALLVLKSNSAWIQYFINTDPSIYISAASCPVLALNGNKDLQVDADINLSAMEKILSAVRKDRNTWKVVTYEGLNHLFQHTITGSPIEYGQIEETLSEQVLKDISEWILDTTRAR